MTSASVAAAIYTCDCGHVNIWREEGWESKLCLGCGTLGIGTVTYTDVPENTLSPELIFSAADSPARTSRTPESAPASMASAADCGPNTRESFASFDRDTSLWRTSQLCFTGEWSEFSETWPRSGMTRSGKAFELPMLARHTGENESGLLPTPTDVSKGGGSSRSGDRIGETPSLQGMARKGNWPTPAGIGGLDGHGSELSQAVKYRTEPGGPTPTSSDYKTPPTNLGSRSKSSVMPDSEHALPAVVGGQLSPTWVEWLMGFPLEWTACADSETRSSRKSRKSSGGASSPPKETPPMYDLRDEHPDLVRDVEKFVRDKKRAHVTEIQRAFRVGFGRAMCWIDCLKRDGVITDSGEVKA
jgi:hypothetical protein